MASPTALSACLLRIVITWQEHQRFCRISIFKPSSAQTKDYDDDRLLACDGIDICFGRICNRAQWSGRLWEVGPLKRRLFQLLQISDWLWRKENYRFKLSWNLQIQNYSKPYFSSFSGHPHPPRRLLIRLQLREWGFGAWSHQDHQDLIYNLILIIRNSPIFELVHCIVIVTHRNTLDWIKVMKGLYVGDDAATTAANAWPPLTPQSQKVSSASYHTRCAKAT